MTAPQNYVVIPTYQEVGNLKKLLPLLRPYKVIIVDDNSKDGTEEVCARFKNVELIVRKGKRGMASASLEGLRAIKDYGAKVVFMDADFEHDPSKISMFFDAMKKADMVIGVKKGKRSTIRRMISSVGKVAVNSVLPNSKMLSDPMSCFFGLKLSSLNKSAIQKIEVEPYGKLMLVLFENLRPRAAIKEIDYAYRERKTGASKISRSYFFDYIKEIIKLNKGRFISFFVIGLLGIPLNEGIAVLLYPYLPLTWDFFFAISVSTVVNFLANHYITFKSRSDFWTAFTKFLLISGLITGVTNFLIALFLSYEIFYLFANLIGIIAGFTVKYVLSETYIWKNTSQKYRLEENAIK